MPEPVRLVCPECELVYKVKRLTLGKEYTCRSCGAGLRCLEPVTLACAGCGTETAAERLDPAAVPECPGCGKTLAAPSLTPPPAPAAPAAAAGPRSGGRVPESDLVRLPRLVEELTARLETLSAAASAEESSRPDETVQQLLAKTDSLSETLGALNGRLETDLGGLAQEIRELDGRITGLMGQMPADALASLAEQMKASGAAVLARLEEYREAQKAELVQLLPPGKDGSTTVEVNIDELADRLAAGIRSRTLLDPETGSAVDALARVADELVREQDANSARLDTLASEIRNALAGISRMDEWRGELPVRVAENIGRMVDDRVVGPVSAALSRQAPAILSDLQDSKLVDIVSRSVREAQRPLLREILSGGRGGVPAWLFASVLLPLLFILGYLFLPGELGFGDNAAAIEAVAQGVYRLEEGGALGPEAAAALRNIEFEIRDIREKALEHAGNAAALEQQVRSLEAELADKVRLLKEYDETVSAQTRRLRQYETRLTQLGVSPDNIQ